ncbi:MAG: endonuclease/exonuclease/phosphatase family protein [Saprospiraceae bacterium]
MTRLLWWSHIGIAVLTVAAYLSPYISPDTLWPFSFAALLFPTLVLINILLAGWWVYKGKRYWILSALLLAIGFGNLRELIGTGSAKESNQSITVGVYNLLGGKHIYDTDKAALSENLAAFQECLQVDVLATAETPLYDVARRAVAKSLDRKGLKYHYFPPESFVAIHSRYPLIKPRLIEAFNQTHGLIAAEIVPVKGGDTLTILAAHLESNHVRLDAKRVIKDAAKARKRAYWTIRDVAINYRRGARKRTSQAELIAKTIGESPYPVVLMGDLNDTPLSYTLGTISRAGLVDAFRQNGQGLGITYPGTIPGLRIDYVLADPSLTVLAADVIDCGFSDHNATTARLGL